MGNKNYKNIQDDKLDFNYKKEYVSKAGKPQKNNEIYSSEDKIIKCLRSIYDPEIPVSIYDLGLIYEIKILKGISIKSAINNFTVKSPIAKVTHGTPVL